MLNLPCNKDFDPPLPWVYCWDEEQGGLAGAVETYVDDGKVVDNFIEHAWQIYHRYGSRLQHFGLQPVLRKVQPPTIYSVWSGTKMTTSKEKVRNLVTQPEWKKGQ